jgi:hypothetical protein
MTTTTEPTSGYTDGDRRRMKALRWLLSLAGANGLPMPTRIDLREYHSKVRSATVRCLTLELDDDTDLTGWADAIGASEIGDLDVTGKTHTWTYVHACTPWRDDEPVSTGTGPRSPATTTVGPAPTSRR